MLLQDDDGESGDTPDDSGGSASLDSGINAQHERIRKRKRSETKESIDVEKVRD